MKYLLFALLLLAPLLLLTSCGVVSGTVDFGFIKIPSILILVVILVVFFIRRKKK